MTQEPLFQDLSDERLAAIGADVDAAGGEKVVGSALWPKLSADTAGRKLANCLNSKQKHALTAAELWTIKQLARKAMGRSRIFEFEAAQLQADIHWVTEVEQIERREQRLEGLLGQVFQELQDLKQARAAMGKR
jgi:hypothetical protein